MIDDDIYADIDSDERWGAKFADSSEYDGDPNKPSLYPLDEELREMDSVLDESYVDIDDI